jgi:hypothetical protein
MNHSAVVMAKKAAAAQPPIATAKCLDHRRKFSNISNLKRRYFAMKVLPLLSDFSNLSATSIRMASKSLPARAGAKERPVNFKSDLVSPLLFESLLDNSIFCI